MGEFEFLSVLISIIFGLAMTQVMSGVVRAVYQGELHHDLLVYSAFTMVVLVVNWFVSFGYNSNPQWRFGTFLTLVLWAVGHYGMAAALYPPSNTGSVTMEARRRYFLSMFAVTIVLDISATAIRGALLSPWYYPLLMAHLLLVTGIGIKYSSVLLHRFLAWWLLLITLAWGLVVRSMLSELV